jgi:hypothetical protein
VPLLTDSGIKEKKFKSADLKNEIKGFMEPITVKSASLLVSKPGISISIK